MTVYREKDMVEVVDAEGNELPAIPKAWLGTDLVPAGVEKKGRSSGGSGSDNPDTVAAILKDVGDDKEKAQAALDAEQAKGDEARSSLVEKLQAVIAKEA